MPEVDPFAFTEIRYPSALSPTYGFECLIDHKGQPHDVSFSPTRQPASLEITFLREAEPAYGAGRRATGIKTVDVGAPYREGGWKSRREYFREWWKSTKSKAKREEIVWCWERWCDFYERCHDERRPSVARKIFPDKWLPPAEVALRKKWESVQRLGEWEPEQMSDAVDDVGEAMAEEASGEEVTASA
jgi:hypothetical protein